ncbi:MAG: Asp-tRNA(Asn)/Glu-tRNA(Gln) amidotransferase subunit GatB [Anaerolineae bacterium]|nr:Asp-tRNA(Asn)/Glu-tRNA(Gln) amidotransferase subunit GatB [Anaerolineae bacterium]
MDYEAVIGMEVHAELCTHSKMFCGCSAGFFGAEANTHVCPVCMGYPGVLPVVNARAIEYAVRVGLALNCQIAPFSKFDRKNYTYPDLPKGYQISQYDLPLCRDGWLDIEVEGAKRRIRIRRAHLEEDTAKEFHVEGASLVDFNRSGVPLLEIVTEPDIRSGEEARCFLVHLRAILRALEVSTADMEKGAMRCEPNVSVRPVGSTALGVKTEIKNLNSFRSVKQAIEYEVARQIDVISSGGRVEQVTMGWNERDNHTVVQRSKEQAQDYRYFPEPDLAPIEIDAAYVDRVRAALPELPGARRDRLVSAYGLRTEDAEILASEAELGAFFEDCVIEGRGAGIEPATVCNWITGELFRLLNEQGLSIADSTVSPGALASLLAEVEQGAINVNTAKGVLADMFATGRGAAEIIAEQGLAQVSDEDQIRRLVVRAVAEHPDALQEYLAGKTSVAGFFFGQVMRASQGKANPQVVRQVLTAHLDAQRTAADLG